MADKAIEDSMETVQITDLRCEYVQCPIGIDIVQPRLSWQLTGTRQGLAQTAYRIRVGTEPGKNDVWDSGKVKTPQSIHVVYAGHALKSRQRVHWNVTVWDEADTAIESESSWWEMGILNPAEWTSSWIESAVSGGPWTSVPATYFRRQIYSEKPMIRARLYVCALGVYNCYINGKRVGDHELAPGWTDYNKRIRYQTYDVTEDMTKGHNIFAFVVGDGWYCGHVEWRGRQLYGDRPRLRAQLMIEFVDGTSLTLGSDDAWRTSTGSILQTDLLMGQSQDERLEPKGWMNVASFEDSDWPPAIVLDELEVPMVGQNTPPIRVQEEIRPVSLTTKHQWPHRRSIYDMGQNMVGRIRLNLKAKPGETYIIRYAEILDANGNLYVDNLRSAKQTDYFTAKGDPNGEVFEPLYTFHGFRYVEIVCPGDEPTIDDVTGIVLHSSWRKTSEFECSDPLLNQLHSNILWGWKGNSLDVPTDCPQRDERLGWTGDAQVFVGTASYIADVAAFFAKYQQDMTDAQDASGAIPPTAPDTGATKQPDGGPAWSDAYVLCAWEIYRHFGDTEILRNHYEGMKRWLAQQLETSKDFARSYAGYEGFMGFGDWLSIGDDTPHEIIGTAFFAHSTATLGKIAKVLGENEDAKAFQKQRDKIAAAFRKRFVTEDGRVYPGSQTAHVLALKFDLLLPNQREVAVQMLVDNIVKKGYHLSTGFVGSPHINPVLTDGGRLDVAYKLLHQKTWPSWLYSVTQGATTIWERWDGWTQEKGFQDAGMNSFNHYAYGAIGEWIYSTVLGIQLDDNVPAFKKSVLAPRPGGELTYAKGSVNTPYGPLSSSWKLEAGKFLWEVQVPPNTTTMIVLPHEVIDAKIEGEAFERQIEVPAGIYKIEAVWK